MNTKEYTSPLVTRAASKAMSKLWGDTYKFTLWRTLWAELAAAQHSVGIKIDADQVDELRANKIITDKEIKRAEELEEELKHDVMSHIKVYGETCPNSKGIIHLGATSQFVVDNADIIRIKQSLHIIRKKLLETIFMIANFADSHKHIATVGLTHFQPAQPTTVGKRAAMWCYDLIIALEDLNFKINTLRLRGIKGATGTEASFLILCDGDHQKVAQINEILLRAFNFGPLQFHPITGQVYPRVCDSLVISSLASIGAVCQKIATDIRLLSGKGELYESFGSNQVGSSAMPYKKNPITAEKICGLSRYLISQLNAGFTTASEQWLERSLDDSITKRIIMPETMLATDGILLSMQKLFNGLSINEKEINKNVNNHNDYAMMEDLMMLASNLGADRQDVHEMLRQSMLDNNFEEFKNKLSKDKKFSELCDMLPIDNTGRACQQTVEFIDEFIIPLREEYTAMYSK